MRNLVQLFESEAAHCLPAFQLLLLADPHAHDQAHDEVDHRRDSCGVDHAEGGTSHVLAQQQGASAVNDPIRGVKETAKDSANKATDSVEAEAIEAVVHEVQLLQPAGCEDAGQCPDGSHTQSAQGLHEASARSDVHLVTPSKNSYVLPKR